MGNRLALHVATLIENFKLNSHILKVKIFHTRRLRIEIARVFLLCKHIRYYSNNNTKTTKYMLR